MNDDLKEYEENKFKLEDKIRALAEERSEQSTQIKQLQWERDQEAKKSTKECLRLNEKQDRDRQDFLV